MPHEDEQATLHDLGEKPPKAGGPPVEAPSRPYYPSVHLSSKQLPKLDDMDVGDKVTLLAEGVIRSKEERNDEVHCEIELRKARVTFKG